MDVKEYSKNIDIELNAWRAKLNDVMSQKGALPLSDQQKINEQLNGIHTIVHELDERINQLRTSCLTKYNEIDSYFY